MIQVLEADSIWLEYAGQKILQSIYLKIETGKIVGLLGRNGTGKSSLLRMIFGTLRGQNQSIRINGNHISHPYLAKNLIRYLPQHNFVPPYLKLEELCGIYEVSFSKMADYFPELHAFEKQKIGTLSGGNRRLVETLLILLSPVSFILMDEPFTHLAPVTAEKLSVVIMEQKKQKGILVSDHSYRQVLDLSDDVYLIVPVGRSILLKNPEQELQLLGYTR